MDPFDEAILAALEDGKARIFTQLLDGTGISHNTLRLHLENLANQGLVVKGKNTCNGTRKAKIRLSHPANSAAAGFRRSLRSVY